MGATSRKLIVVAGSEHGIVLIDFIAKRLGLSNKASKRLLDAHSVFVNNRRTWMARHILVAGDRVEAHVDNAAPRPLRGPAILFEDDSYLVVDKPSGLLANGPDSVESALRSSLQREVYAAHRLDRETSGCLLLTKSVAARDEIIPLFMSRDITKIYHAIVSGRVTRARQTIKEPIDNQPAVTHARVLKSTDATSFLELILETGRTHQIRKHLSSIGHPVVGDRTYATRGVEQSGLRNVPRQMLHASRIAFTHPRTGRSVDVSAPFPPDFKLCQAMLHLRPNPKPHHARAP